MWKTNKRSIEQIVLFMDGWAKHSVLEPSDRVERAGGNGRRVGMIVIGLALASELVMPKRDRGIDRRGSGRGPHNSGEATSGNRDTDRDQSCTVARVDPK